MERKCTIQSLNSVENDKESKKEEVEISKPKLKPLPHGLKYVYLEENVAIASPLSLTRAL